VGKVTTFPTEPTIAVERREAPRYVVEAPVGLEAGDTGMLRNMSTSGALFRIHRRFTSGEHFRFCWSSADADVARDRVCCEATVVRVEEQETEWRVAASIESVTFNPIDPGGEISHPNVRVPNRRLS
jgi:PilZ domain